MVPGCRVGQPNRHLPEYLGSPITAVFNGRPGKMSLMDYIVRVFGLFAITLTYKNNRIRKHDIYGNYFVLSP